MGGKRNTICCHFRAGWKTTIKLLPKIFTTRKLKWAKGQTELIWMKNEGLKWLCSDLTVRKNKQEHLLAVLSAVCKFCKFWWRESELPFWSQSGLHWAHLFVMDKFRFVKNYANPVFRFRLIILLYNVILQIISFCWWSFGVFSPQSALMFVFVSWGKRCVRIKQSWRLLSFFVLSFYCVLVRAPV